MPTDSAPSLEGPLFDGRDLACVRGERAVFARLHFSLPAGGALVLRGPNGSGKSSLLRVMAGLVPAATGTLRRNGVPVAEDPEAHRAGLHYIGHLDALKPALTARENLDFWAGLHPDNAAAASRRARTAAGLTALGIVGLAEVPGRFLSAGERRRLALARLVAAPVPLWLLDEPTVALDTASVATLSALVARHREGGGAVVLSTHADLALDGAQTLDLREFAVPREAMAS